MDTPLFPQAPQEQFQLIFEADANAAARNHAIDQLHNATAIYTAEAVVDELLDRLRWPSGSRRLADTSAGDGMFIGRALKRALATPGVSDTELLATIEGFEIHPNACAQARSRVSNMLVNAGRSSAVADDVARRMVHNRDFLTTGPTAPAWDVIVGNPPYLRKVNIPQVLRDDYQRHVPDFATGDMLHSFLHRCAQTLHEGGEIAMVTSDRWLYAQGTAKLRGALGERRLSIQHLERLDVQSAFYRPKQRRAGAPPRIHPISVLLGHGAGQPLTHEPIYPGANPERYRGMPTLADIATVRLAPWLVMWSIFRCLKSS